MVKRCDFCGYWPASHKIADSPMVLCRECILRDDIWEKLDRWANTDITLSPG